MSPYYIHPSENPDILLVTTPLTTRNYQQWSRMMRKALVSKNKIKFLNGFLPVLDPFDLNYDAWERCNDILHSWLVNSILPNLQQNILYKETTAEVWKLLREHYATVDRVRFFDLQHELYQLKQDNLSVTDFFTDLSGLWEELENYRPMPECTCAIRCICESIVARASREEDYVMRFLKGLNDNYAMVKSQILLMKDLRSLNSVLSMVLEHECQNGLEPTTNDSQVLVNVADGKKSTSRGRRNQSNKQCSYCGKSGHTVDTCY